MTTAQTGTPPRRKQTPEAVYRITYQRPHWRRSHTRIFLTRGAAFSLARRLATGGDDWPPVAKVEIDRLAVVGTWEPVPWERWRR